MKAIHRSQRVAVTVLGVALLLGLAVNAGTAGAAVPPGLRAQTKTSLTDTNRDCGGALISPSEKALGAATMNQTRAPANGRLTSNLSAELTIQGATAGATYGIRLIQADSSGSAVGDSCQTVLGTVTVDALGNGSATVATRVLPGATQWWVDLNNQVNVADFLDTESVLIL
jgi:hypothetical protein